MSYRRRGLGQASPTSCPPGTVYIPGMSSSLAPAGPGECFTPSTTLTPAAQAAILAHAGDPGSVTMSYAIPSAGSTSFFSSIPWWGWALGAGAALMLFGGR